MADKHTVRFEPVGIDIEVSEDQTVLRAAAEQGIMLMHGCKEGQCSSCKSFVLDGDDIELDRYSTFALPDLRGRVPIHQGNGFILAETGGAEQITLTVQQIPAHTHPMMGSTAVASTAVPQNAVVAQDNIVGVDLYIEDVAIANMAPTAVTTVGGSQPHTNFQPYLCVDFIISLFGIFPSPT